MDLDGRAGCPQNSQCLTTPVGHITVHAEDDDEDGDSTDNADDASGVAQITCNALTPTSSGGWQTNLWSECNTVPSTMNLSEGLNQVKAVAYDRAGNENDVNLAPQGRRWFVDTKKPSIQQLSLHFDTIEVHNGWRNVQPDVKVIAHDPGPSSGFGDDAIELRADDGKLTCPVTATGGPDDGTTAMTKTCEATDLNLDEGEHVYTAVVKDRAGHESEVSDPLSSKLDTKNPSSDIFVGPASPDGKNSWYRSRPFLAFVASDGPGGSGVDPADDHDNPKVGAGIHIKIDAGPWELYDPAGDYVLGDGTHTVCWYAIDVAGNREDADLGTPGDQDHCRSGIKVDTTAPSVTAPIAPASPNGSNGFYISKPTVTPGGSDPVPAPGTVISGIDKVEYQVDDGPWTASAPVVVQEGEHEVRVRAFDRAGNAAPMSERVVRVDLANPSAALFGYPPNPNTYGWFRQPRVDLAAMRDPRLGDPRFGSGDGGVTFTLDGGPGQEYLAPFTIVPGATRTATVKPRDRAGRTGPTLSQSSKIDVIAPVANPSPVAADNVTLLRSLLGSLLPALAPTTLAFTVSDNMSSRLRVAVHVFDQFENRVKSIAVPGPHPGGYRNAGQGSVTWNGTNDAGKGVLPGVYHYRVSAVDLAGNTVSSTESLTFLVVLGLLPL